MRTFYNWAMRYGSQLLFAVSVASFMIGLGQALLGDSIPGRSSGVPADQLFVLLTALVGALNFGVWPFIGAVLIHRWDHSKRDEITKAGERQEV